MQKTSLEKKLEQEVKEKKEVASLKIKLMSEVHSAQVNMVIKDEKIKSQDKAITLLENEIAVKEEVRIASTKFLFLVIYLTNVVYGFMCHLSMFKLSFMFLLLNIA